MRSIAIVYRLTKIMTSTRITILNYPVFIVNIYSASLIDPSHNLQVGIHCDFLFMENNEKRWTD
ncbi:MAG TPA: hypothetical protein VFU29_23890 [Chitinophagaceae bacterium]|nr:hypothetical protein [Chitinophagaceae bacterium]